MQDDQKFMPVQLVNGDISGVLQAKLFNTLQWRPHSALNVSE